MPTLTRAGYIPPKDEEPKKSPPPRKEKPKKKKKRRRRIGAATVISLLIFLLAAAVGAGTLYLYVQTSPYRETFAPGTSVGGYALGGYGYAEGEAFVRQLTQERLANWHFEIGYEGTSYVLTAQDVDLKADAEATLTALWKRGKGNFMSAWIDLLRLKHEPVDAQPEITYDLAAADELLELVKADIDCEPQDAAVSFTPGDSEPFAYRQEAVGLSLDTAPLRAAIEDSLRVLTPGKAQASPQEIVPDVLAADLAAATVLRARVVTTLIEEDGQLTNAALAAKALGGAMILPGETLSFNEAVGERTESEGYVVAAEPAYGEDVQGVGGGVCQTATALYQLALLADVPVTERHAAARIVPYAEAGQEAAVSGQGLDLTIENDTDTPLYLTARIYADGGAHKLEMQLIGAPLSARYALITENTELPPPEEPIYVRDSAGTYATYMDERIPVIEAKSGTLAKVYRVALGEGGQEASREAISEDEYAPVAQAIYVGIQQRE